MKIAFLVGGLEAGANGVGDYSRLLAREIKRQQPGAHCQLISLNDGHISEPQSEMGDDAQLRLPATMPWAARIERARRFLDEFAPDVVSLQFVPYAFHSKGIVSGLAAHLQPLVQQRRFHIMFHELWIGTNVEADLKEVAIGKIQRHYVLQLIRRLPPATISTSNGVYMATLQSHALQAAHLPLFGNIPIVDAAMSDAPELQSLTALLGDTPAQSRDWTGVFFGSLHPTWRAEPLLSRLTEIARQQQRRLHLVAAGRLGDAGESIWNEMSGRPSSDARFTYVGERSPAQISWLFRQADFGVAASPWQLIEKSGSAASMLDHGLPVIVNRDDWHWRGTSPVTPPSDPLLHRFNGDNLQFADLKKRTPQETLPAVAAKFLEQIQS